MSDHVRAALATIVDGGSLTLEDARLAMGAVMDGEATAAQLAAMLMGLRMRGETVDELAGFASAMRERVVRVDRRHLQLQLTLRPVDPESSTDADLDAVGHADATDPPAGRFHSLQAL